MNLTKCPLAAETFALILWQVIDVRMTNQIFHYTRCITPKRVTSLRGPSPRHWARATQLLSKKCHSIGEHLSTLRPVWPARDLNLRPPAPETNALPLDQLPMSPLNNFSDFIEPIFVTLKKITHLNIKAIWFSKNIAKYSKFIKNYVLRKLIISYRQYTESYRYNQTFD